jgi:HEAT repeat protein
MASLARLIAVRPGEGRLVALVAGAFATVEMGRGLGETGIDALVLSRLGADAYPPLFIGLGIVGLVTSLAYGAALARSRSERFFPTLLLVIAAILAVEWLAALSGIEAIVPVLWISVYAAGMLLLTVTWTVAGAVFDARQAKRLFPLITSAAVVGSLSGFLAAIVIQRLLGAEQLILAEAGAFAVAGALLAGIGPRLRPRPRPGELRMSVGAALTSGASYVARSPLMRWVALAYVLLAVLMFSITFPFMTAMRDEFGGEDGLIVALALFSAGVTGASFLVGVLLANRVYARFGVATAAVVLPVVYLLGFGAWIVRFSLATAVVVRFAQQVTQRGISNAAWGAFFSVIPSARRGPVMAFMDGVPGQFGTFLSGVTIIVAGREALQGVFVVGLVTAAICLVVVLMIRRAYAQALVTTLRSGLAEQVLTGGPGLAALAHEPSVRAALVEATRSETATERLLATELLVGFSDAASDASLVELAGDPDPTVRLAALRGLAARPVDAALPVLRAALSDPDAAVRVTAVRGLASHEDGVGPLPDSDLRDLLAPLSRDPSPLVRGEIAVALGSRGRLDAAEPIVAALLDDEGPAGRTAGLDAIARLAAPVRVDAVPALRADAAPEVRAAALRASAAHPAEGLEIYLDAFHDPAHEVRLAAATAICTRPGGVDAALAMLFDGSAIEQETALEALVGHELAARDRLITWADREVARATALRATAAILARAAPQSSAAFLGRIASRRASAIVSRLLSALALLGAPEAGGLIRRCLASTDAEVRAQAIEALDSIGDARLARGVVRLLDSDATAGTDGPPDIVATADSLRADPDPWIRAMALRTLWEERPDERRALHAYAQADTDPAVRAAVSDEEDVDVTETTRLVSDIDRMLVLRRVEIFAALDPEDLQRVAALAIERRWGGGEPIMVEGDIGSELVVIVEGSVRVVHVDEDQEHFLRRYGPGDHIGELAVLREAPRAATVVAEDPGVRGLVIGGEAIHALLRERPDAAMAMLATLADRISQQA